MIPKASVSGIILGWAGAIILLSWQYEKLPDKHLPKD